MQKQPTTTTTTLPDLHGATNNKIRLASAATELLFARRDDDVRLTARRQREKVEKDLHFTRMKISVQKDVQDNWNQCTTQQDVPAMYKVYNSRTSAGVHSKSSAAARCAAVAQGRFKR